MFYRRYILGILALGAIVLLVFYGYGQAKTYLGGPLVVFHTIERTGETYEKVRIRGEARYISHLSVNGHTIFTSPEGSFDETLLVFPGYTIITLEAEDRFGRSKRVSQALYTP